MLKQVINLLPAGPTRDTGMLVGGMAALLGGNKVMGLALFGRGAWHTEQRWRAHHPDFDGTWQHRWQLAVEHYERTHQDPINRSLHMVGIPMIAVGAAGLLVSGPARPLWLLSAASFTVGWALNIVGHAAFEKNAPAFADDPLSFIAGPVWDLRNLGVVRGRERSPASVNSMAPVAQA